MRFFTRNKKPKLYDALIAAVAAVLAVTLLHIFGNGRFSLLSAVITDAALVYVIVRLAFAFAGQIRYNPYSYNTIFYFGFSVFTLFVLITNVTVTFRTALHPDVYNEEMILRTLLNSAKDYMIYTSPFILVFSVALCVSNVSLIKHEGKRFVNLLGILLSALLISGEAFLFTFDFYASCSQFEVMMHDLFGNLFAAVYLYFECMIIGIIASHIIVSKYEPTPDRDFIIILGCGLNKDGTPTPLLCGRVDRAISFAEKQEKLTGKKATFITSGGKGDDERSSESASMKRYMLSLGIPEERIIEEDRSTTTEENMIFSKKKIDELDKNAKVAFSTTNYHVFRGGLYAAHEKIRAEGMGSKTKWYFWPNASVREFGGLLIAHKGKQAVILCAMIAVYIAMTLIAYR